MSLFGAVQDDRTADNAPAYPHLTDDHVPNDENLWNLVLDVARGKRREFTRLDRTIHAPNHGRGFRHWPSPKATAWAVKQYNGFNGGWKSNGKNAAIDILSREETCSKEGSEEHLALQVLEARGLVRLANVAPSGWFYWATTDQGSRVVVAGLADDLKRRVLEFTSMPIEDAASAAVYAKAASDLYDWFTTNFSVLSAKTPRGGKDLKKVLEGLEHYVRVAKHNMADPQLLAMNPHISPEQALTAMKKNQAEVLQRWHEVEKVLASVVQLFTTEGGQEEIPKELEINGILYLNEIGVKESTVRAYATRLDAVFKSLHGWRAKALSGQVKVQLASPRVMTTQGKYRSAQDIIMVRATPAILRREGGTYGSFDYILVHEIGHRYEKKNSTPDFDRPEWVTSKYSRNEGEAFAELFAIGHFKMRGDWNMQIVERFEKVMG